MDYSDGHLLTEGVYRIGGPISTPQLISRPDLPEPEIEGSVLLQAVIGPDGIPREICAVKPVDNRLEQIAIDNLRQWRFQPAYKRRSRREIKAQGAASSLTSCEDQSGEPVAVGATFEMHFRRRQKQDGNPVVRIGL
jgi:hypothetical protein